MLMKFSHDPYLGYVTSRPCALGTAMRLTVRLRLEKLAQVNHGTLPNLADKYELLFRGVHGEHTETDDGVFDVSST